VPSNWGDYFENVAPVIVTRKYRLVEGYPKGDVSRSLASPFGLFKKREGRREERAERCLGYCTRGKLHSAENKLSGRFGACVLVWAPGTVLKLMLILLTIRVSFYGWLRRLNDASGRNVSCSKGPQRLAVCDTGQPTNLFLLYQGLRQLFNTVNFRLSLHMMFHRGLLFRVAIMSAKNHKRQRCKRQSVIPKRETSQTLNILTAILT